MAKNTYRTISFKRWYAMAAKEFAKLNAALPDPATAMAAYALGETPETWARYVALCIA